MCMLSWKHSGFSLDASIRIPAVLRNSLEDLLLYIYRHPFTMSGIHYDPISKSVHYHAAKKYLGRNTDVISTGTDAEFIAWLSQHIPHARTLAGMVAAIQTNISREALHQRFTAAASAFLFRCLQFVMHQKLHHPPVSAELLSHFRRVVIVDPEVKRRIKPIRNRTSWDQGLVWSDLASFPPSTSPPSG